MICSICFSTVEQTKHFSIYIAGSEGVELCSICLLDLTEHLRQLKGIACRAKLETYKRIKKESYARQRDLSALRTEV